jgi:hypothetical protein
MNAFESTLVLLLFAGFLCVVLYAWWLFAVWFRSWIDRHL